MLKKVNMCLFETEEVNVESLIIMYGMYVGGFLFWLLCIINMIQLWRL